MARCFIDNIKKNGPTFLRSLRVDDYYYFMVHATPHVTVKKPKSKKDGYDKAFELPRVRSALDFFPPLLPSRPKCIFRRLQGFRARK